MLHIRTYVQYEAFSGWLTSRYEPWEQDLTLAVMRVEEAGLIQSIFHNGNELLPNPDWLFQRAKEERASELLAFSLRTFTVPLAGMVLGFCLASLAFIREIKICKG